MMSRARIVLMVLLWVGSIFAIAASVLYSYVGNTVWYLGPRVATTPDTVLIPVILAVAVISCIRLCKKRN
jgi:hypothetical protein